MPMRSMQHAPEAYLDQNAVAIVARMTAETDLEAAARAGAAWGELDRHESKKSAPDLHPGAAERPRNRARDGLWKCCAVMRFRGTRALSSVG